MKTLILGGMRAGKTRHAQELALAGRKSVVYVATALPGDEEMRARIARHKMDRPPEWITVEEPYALADVLQRRTADDVCVLVDCLTLWLTQLLCAGDDGEMQKEVEALLAVYARAAGDLILIGNETNLGVVPMDELSRRYCDAAGRLHQAVAAQSDQVILMVAGLPLKLKERI